MTSSISSPRRPLAELSPIAQRNASTMFDLPQPFGPTMPVKPASIAISAGSENDLKPLSRRRERRKVASSGGSGGQAHFGSSGAVIWGGSSIERSPADFFPSMTEGGVGAAWDFFSPSSPGWRGAVSGGLA